MIRYIILIAVISGCMTPSWRYSSPEYLDAVGRLCGEERMKDYTPVTGRVTCIKERRTPSND